MLFVVISGSAVAVTLLVLLVVQQVRQRRALQTVLRNVLQKRKEERHE